MRLESYYSAQFWLTLASINVSATQKLKGSKNRVEEDVRIAHEKVRAAREETKAVQKELEQERSPYYLPPLLHSAFDQFAPEKGSLTKESDRAAVRWLTEEARKDIKELVGGVGGRLGGRSPGRGAGWQPGRGGAAARASGCPLAAAN